MKIQKETFYEDSEQLIREIIDLLHKAKAELDKRYDTHQRKLDLRAGLVRRGGIYVPFRSIEHRIIFDAYEVQFLDTFIKLYRRMFENEETIFKEFAIRTLSEMGFCKSQILFNNTLGKREREKYKLVLMLADYAFLGPDHPGRASDFRKLFREHGGLLTEKQRELFEQMEKHLDSKDREEHDRLVKKIRKLCEGIQDELYRKTTTPKFLNETSIKAYLSSYSHLLHGNIILLEDVLSPKRPEYRLRLRVTWLLLMVGMNTLVHASSFLGWDDLKELENRFLNVSQNLSAKWRQLEISRKG